MLEGIQKKFIRFISRKFNIPKQDYTHLCHQLHLLPLHTRREIADICLLVKIAQGIIDSPELLSMIKLITPTRKLRNHTLLYCPFSRTHYRNNSFLPRSIKKFNKLNQDDQIDLFASSARSVKSKMLRLCLPA